MKAVVAAFNQEKALVGAFSVITNLRMELFEALIFTRNILITQAGVPGGGQQRPGAGPGPGHGGEAGQAAAGVRQGHRGRGGGGVLRPRVRADAEMIVTSCILHCQDI